MNTPKQEPEEFEKRYIELTVDYSSLEYYLNLHWKLIEEKFEGEKHLAVVKKSFRQES